MTAARVAPSSRAFSRLPQDLERYREKALELGQAGRLHVHRDFLHLSAHKPSFAKTSIPGKSPARPVGGWRVSSRAGGIFFHTQMNS